MIEPIAPVRRHLIAELQERAARAVPAAVERYTGGDWLRLHDSSATWWAGAALLHDAAAAPLDERIAAAETFYVAHDQAARFQICPGCPPDLDVVLFRRGYQRQHPVSLQVQTPATRPPLRPNVASAAVLLNEPDAGWFAIWVATAGPQVDVDAEWRLLQRVKSPSGYVTVSIAGRPVSVGRAVADTGCAGIFNMATLPEARGQGAARAVLTALTNWATDQDTHRLYLQVEHDNAAALAVYRRAGFHHLCTYHYRTAALQLSDSPNAL